MRIAITGTIGAGKSEVSNYLKNKGYIVEDMDQWVHKLYEQPNVIKEIERVFTTSLLTTEGILDRKKLGNIVFSDKSNLRKLEALIHPLVYNTVSTLPSNVFIEVPVLFESKGQSYFDKIICVDADTDIRIQRLLNRGLTITDIEKRNANQMDGDIKQALSDYVVINNGDKQELFTQVDNILKELGYEQN